MVRTVPGHMIWCSAEGTPPINMSLLQDSTLLAQGTGIAAANVTKEGNVTCVATNSAGSVSKTFPVTLEGLPFVLFVLFVFAFKYLFIYLRLTQSADSSLTY